MLPYLLGVTVMLDNPDVSDTKSSLPGTEPLGSDRATVTTSKQDEVAVEWDEPTAANIDAECKLINLSSDIYFSWKSVSVIFMRNTKNVLITFILLTVYIQRCLLAAIYAFTYNFW